MCTWCNVCDNGRQTKSSDPDAEARSLRMIMCLTDALIRLNRCIKLTTHGSQAFRWVVGTSFSTTTWITEICVKAGCQRTSQTVTNLVVLDSVLYVWYATRIKEIRFSSALLKRQNTILIRRRPEKRSNHEMENPFISLGKLQSLRKICLLGPGRRLSEGRDSDWLRAGQSGDRISMGARFFFPVQTDPRVHTASCKIGTGLLLQGAGTWYWPSTLF